MKGGTVFKKESIFQESREVSGDTQTIRIPILHDENRDDPMVLKRRENVALASHQLYVEVKIVVTSLKSKSYNKNNLEIKKMKKTKFSIDNE